jgi:hypothetical protein
MTLDPLPWRAKIAPTLCYAYFSAEAANECGSFIYLAHDGSEVEVTCVGEDLIDCGSYKWPDRKSVGPVVAWLRIGQTGRLGFISF